MKIKYVIYKINTSFCNGDMETNCIYVWDEDTLESAESWLETSGLIYSCNTYTILKTYTKEGA